MGEAPPKSSYRPTGQRFMIGAPGYNLAINIPFIHMYRNPDVTADPSEI